jgi:hypothetical protein
MWRGWKGEEEALIILRRGVVAMLQMGPRVWRCALIPKSYTYTHTHTQRERERERDTDTHIIPWYVLAMTQRLTCASSGPCSHTPHHWANAVASLYFFYSLFRPCSHIHTNTNTHTHTHTHRWREPL